MMRVYVSRLLLFPLFSIKESGDEVPFFLSLIDCFNTPRLGFPSAGQSPAASALPWSESEVKTNR